MRIFSYIKENLVVVVLSVCALFVIGLLVFNLVSKSGKASVAYRAVPADAKITVNGKAARGNPLRLGPGTYSIQASKEGYKSSDNTVTITDTKKKQPPIFFLLRAVSEDAQKWAQANRQKYLDAEGAAGIASQDAGEIFYADNSIAQLLPYSDMRYRIDYKTEASGEGAIALQITALSPEAKSLAIDKIREWGYDPTDYKIIFLNYANPFVAEDEGADGE